MAVPSAITDLSTTPASNSPAGTESVSTMDDYLRTLSAFIRQNYDSITTNTTDTTTALANIVPRAAAGGTVDAITATYSPAVTLSNGTVVLLEAAGANTSTTPTFAPNSLTAKTIVKGSNAALAAGDIPGANAWVLLMYDSSLDKWVLLNPATFRNIGQVVGAYRNLASSASGTSANIAITADQLAVEDSAGNALTLRSVSVTIDSSASGANGLDTGTLAGSTQYFRWIIYNPTTSTTAGLLSLSATSPTMPSGYTHKAFIGGGFTDGTANKYPFSFIQKGNRVQYKVASGSNLTDWRTMASGTPGLTLTAIAIGSYVPSTARSIKILADLPNASYLIIASNSTATSIIASYNAVSGGASSPSFDFILESTNIYWACGASSYVKVQGWEENL